MKFYARRTSIRLIALVSRTVTEGAIRLMRRLGGDTVLYGEIANLHPGPCERCCGLSVNGCESKA